MSEAGDSEQTLPMRTVTPRLTRGEWALLLVLVAIQFTHMVDFVIIMPLGDRLRRELGVSPEQFGTVVASYAWAAGIASLLGSLFMDRFDRRSVLLTMYAGFGVSTLFCGLAPNYELLVLTRTLAGTFGGLAAVSLMAVIGDVFPPEKRGRATGAVVSSFAVATIVGLPVGLMLAAKYGRWAPFVMLACLSLIVLAVGITYLPAVRGHLSTPRQHPFKEFEAAARVPNHLWGFAFSFFLVLGTFTVASFIAPVLSAANNWGEDDLAIVYFAAGTFTLVATIVIGRLADRFSRLMLFRILGGGAMIMAVVLSNLSVVPLWTAAIAVSAFMVCAAGRMVPAHAMILGASAPAMRGAFMSLNTAVQHLATGLAPTIAGAIIVVTADNKLERFPVVGIISAATAGLSLVLAGRIKPVPQHTSQSGIAGEVETQSKVVPEGDCPVVSPAD
jgi:predicted MFS family arabinose efflux permease